MRNHLFLLSLLSCLLLLYFPSTSLGLEGKLQLLKVSDGQLKTKSYSFLENGRSDTSSQALTGPLAGFSLRCGVCPLHAVTRLSLQTQSLRALAVLSDRALSVVHTVNDSTIVTQVIALDKECTPRHLLATGSPTSFAVVCTGHALQIGTFDPNNLHLTLSRLFRYDLAKKYNETNTVFSTRTDSLLRIVTYTGDNLNVYAVTELTPQVWQLPTNINCTSQPTLYPLNIKGAFMMHCMTERGPTLYAVPLRILGDTPAQTILTEGIPYSSRDGSYILVVDGSRLTVYSSEDSRLPLSQKRLPSTIKSVANLDDDNVRVLTENGEHVVINLVNSLAEPRYLPGGPPILSEWVSSSHHYIYLTENGTLYIMNETSTRELEAVGNWSQIMYIEEMKPVDQPTPEPDKVQIVNVVIMVIWFVIITVIIVVIVTCCNSCVKRKNKASAAEEKSQEPASQANQQPSQENPEPASNDSKAIITMELQSDTKPSPVVIEQETQNDKETLYPTLPDNNFLYTKLDEQGPPEPPVPAAEEIEDVPSIKDLEGDGVLLLEAQALQ